MLAEIDRLRDEGPGPEELERVRNLHDATVASTLERIGERADRLSMYTMTFDEPERINDEMARYDAVGATQVSELLEAYTPAENRVVLTYVPAESPVDDATADAAADEEAAA